MKHIILYYQTFYTQDNTLISLDPILYDNTPVSHIHVSSIHFGIDNNEEPYIHLNNKSPYHMYFDPVWKTIEKASSKNINIILMIGGAGGGYSSLFSNFDMYYDLLYNFLKNKPFISGIDLDIEEQCDLDNIKKLIRKIINDFGKDYIITTAPLASSLSENIPGMGGFCYKDLLNSPEGSYIKYINCQAYDNYSLSTFDSIIHNGYSPNQIIMGMLSGQQYSRELKKIVNKYKDTFGGVFTWEYYNAIPNPQDWVKDINSIINNK